MSKSSLLDESLEMAGLTPETPAPAATNLRPTVDLPLELRMQATSYYPATDVLSASYSGWSPELGCYVRVYNSKEQPWADRLFAKYGATKASGELTGKKVTLLIMTHPNSNGLFFAARTEKERDYVSLNEYSIRKTKTWVPDIEMED